MSTSERLSPPLESPNPYLEGIDGLYAKSLLTYVTTNLNPYADKNTNPDLGSKKIYIFDNHDFGSDLGRIAEGQILQMDPQWGQPPEQTAVEAESFEDNSRFFVLVDEVESRPVLVGSLRVADCTKGKSESENFYRASFGNDAELPIEMQNMHDDESSTWDIVYVVVRPEYRSGYDSAWLYYAMHKNSREEDVQEWISNISDDEYKNLRLLGIPFVRMAGVEKVLVENPLDPQHTQQFAFYHTPVEGVADAVQSVSEKYRNREGIAALIGKFATIARYGSETLKPELQLVEN